VFFWFSNEAIRLAHHWKKKKKKLCRVHEIEGSILKYGVPSFWLIHIGERRTIFVKAYGIEVRCYGEHVGELIGNLKGT
jgi:hypothetical protein